MSVNKQATPMLFLFTLPNGQVIKTTAVEAIRDYGITMSSFYHRATPIARTVGNFELWLKSKSLGSTSIQLAHVSPVAHRSLFILWDYQNTKHADGRLVGVKWLAKKYGTSSVTITQLLIDHGINPSERTNHMRAKMDPRKQRKAFYSNVVKRDIGQIVKRRLMNRIHSALAGKPISLRGWFRFVGCSVEALKQHLESMFKDGMTWDNYGTFWEIDHIRPCVSFDLSDPIEFAECNHYTNLQPLTLYENRSKGGRYDA